MTSRSKTYNYSDREFSEAMRQKGKVRGHRIERKADQKASSNPHAKRIEDCAYLKGHGWIAIA